jgi:hypothetical protein
LAVDAVVTEEELSREIWEEAAKLPEPPVEWERREVRCSLLL